jgi:hypothetical protein
MECGCTIDHLHVRAHFLLEHKNVKPPRDLDSQFAAMFAKDYSHLVYPPVPPTVPVDAIYGLKSPLPKYRVCTSCHRGYKGLDPSDLSAPPSKAFKVHHCVPGQTNPSDRTWIESDVQVFDKRPHSAHFAVKATLPATVQSNLWTKYQQQMKSHPSPAGKLSVPHNFRVLDQFLHKEGWLQHVEDKPKDTLRALIALSAQDAQLPNLVKHCEAYLHHHQNTLHSYHARRLISTRPR